MSQFMGTLRSRVLGISRRETLFATRGFASCPDAAREHLERIGAAFVDGYNTALRHGMSPSLVSALNEMEMELCGFGHEGAAMALAILDRLTPWRRTRTAELLGAADQHVYMIHVGIGFALARLRRPPGLTMTALHPLYRWLAVDGYGFHEGFFKTRRSFDQFEVPARVQGYERRVFDQGLGRSLWFASGAQSVRIIECIQRFPKTRRADLWSGVGLACAYAGGTGHAGLKRLCEAAGEYLSDFAQGAAFAAKARARADILMPHTDATCRAACHLSARDAAQLTDVSRQGLPDENEAATNGEPAYEVWRRRVKEGCRMAAGSAAA